MTRKDYIKLAAAFASSRPPSQQSALPEPAHIQWCEDVGQVMRALKYDNARFDPNKFLRACYA